MLQGLLEDRFQLKAHREAREQPIYALVAARGGPKLEAPKDDGCVASAADAAAEWAGGRMAAPGELANAKGRCGSAGVVLGFGGARIQGGKIGMPELARALSLLLSRAVVDRTGFNELFDLQVDFAPDDYTPGLPPPPPGAQPMQGVSIVRALQEGAGLRLEATRGPVDVVVVDRAERPSGN
jgi:uncharacterized protein (TIGR03435 family)